jgi:hypothetical protein
MSYTLLPFDPLLDLPPWVGQRQATFRFLRTDGITGENLGEIHPLRNATLTHDTTRTIKRQLQISLDAVDSAAINPITDRISPFMVFPNGQEYPLGRYMFTDVTEAFYTSGTLASCSLSDEMYLVDQEIPVGIGGAQLSNTSVVAPRSISQVVGQIIGDMKIGIQYEIENSEFNSAESWSIGTSRGSILEALAVAGDYFSPWFGNDTKLHFIRSFDPINKIPDFDFDEGNQVTRADIVKSNDLLTAPNRFVVISNSPADTAVSVVGSASVPPNAPHSLKNRGFEILQVEDIQVQNVGQANAVALNYVNRQTVFERVTMTTAPDPRHDSYNVIRWQGDLWLELAWSLAMTEGGGMNHLLRKAYHP